MSMVLDASVVLAVFSEELDERRTEEILAGGLISATNFSEVLSKLVDVGLDDDGAVSALDAFPLTIVPVDARQARLAGLLRRQTRRYGLSLGDRACLALAASTGFPAITADRVWAKLDLGIETKVIR